MSLYSSVYNHGQPDKQKAKEIRQENFQRYSTTTSRRLQLQDTDRSTSVASCLIWNNTNHENKQKKNNNSTSNILAPITLKTPNNFHSMSIINQPYQSQSIPVFKNTQQSYSGTNSPQQYDDNKLIPLHHINTSLEQTPSNSVECLISKYM